MFYGAYHVTEFCCQGPLSCAPAPVYNIKDVWPPSYQEQMLRNFTITKDTIVEVEESKEMSKSEQNGENIEVVKDNIEIDNDDMFHEEVTDDDEEGNKKVTIEAIDSSKDNEQVDSKYLHPPTILSNSVLYLQSKRRNSLLSSKHQTM